MKTALQLCTFLVALVASVGPGHAQSPPGEPGAAAPFALPGGLSGAALSGAAQGKGNARVSTITTGRSGAARKLAAGYPAAQRAGIERTFEALLQAYPKIESAVGIPAGDAAGALAAFAIASFEAYRDVQVDPGHYKPVIDQVRRVLQASPDFARASAAQRREMYEHMAILAMFVATKRGEAKKSADATALRTVRDEAGQYIAQGLKIDPDRMQIGSGGLAVSTRVTPDRPPGATGPGTAPAPARAKRLAVDKIAGVLNSWWRTYDMSGMQMGEKTYVLFKDGTCTTALEDLDPATSRATNPKEWCRWRKRGKEYEIAFAGEAFFAPENQSIREPARRGERLSGKWSASTGGQVGIDAVYWHNSSAVFTKEGRFEFSSSGGHGGTSGDTTSATVYDDEGSATSVTDPNIGGGGSRRRGSSSADRTGTYSLDGYVLELRYDSGRVEQHLFYAADLRADGDRHFVFVRGTEMTRDKK
jgi:hypothetical protein